MCKLYPAIISLVLFFSCCASQQKVTNPSDFKGRTLQFGSGGGFTGLTTTYTLLENGQLFSQTGIEDGPLKELTCVSKKQVKPLFTAAAKIEWPDKKISNPGNMASSLTYKENGKEHGIIWGGGEYGPPADVLQLYKDLYQIVSPKK